MAKFTLKCVFLVESDVIIIWMTVAGGVILLAVVKEWSEFFRFNFDYRHCIARYDVSPNAKPDKIFVGIITYTNSQFSFSLKAVSLLAFPAMVVV